MTKTRFIRVSAVMLFAFSLSVAAGSTCRASQVAATRFSNTGYTINLSGISGTQQLTRFWSKLSDSAANPINSGYGATGAASGEFRTYCIDLYHTITSSAFNQAAVTVESGLVGDSASPVEHYRDLGKVGWLLNNYDAGVDSGAGWTDSSLAGLNAGQRAAALQAAVWVAGYGIASFTTNNSAVTSATNYLLAQLGDHRDYAGLINYPPPWNGSAGFQSQDMAFAATPEPSSLAIAGLGALAFAGRASRRRRMG